MCVELDVPPPLRRALAASPRALIGIPYVRGGVTPEVGFDCFTLTAFVRWHWYARRTPITAAFPKARKSSVLQCALMLRRMFGRELERIAAPWEHCACAHPGCVVALGMAKCGPLHHCGVWIDDGVLHAVEGVGVAWTPAARIESLFRRVEFFECRD